MGIMSKTTFGLVVVILGLVVWSWCQSNRIDGLKSENQLQAKTIQSLNHNLAEATKQLDDERKAIKKQTALEQTQQEKADDDIKVIYKSIKVQDCSRQRLPDDVIKRLQHIWRRNYLFARSAERT